MKFRNPRGDIIEGRLPRKDENFYDDRFYTDIENVFVRINPKEKNIIITFPCSSEAVLRFSYETMEQLAQKDDVTLFDLIKSAYNVDDVSETAMYRYFCFSEDNKLYILYNQKK